MQPAIFQRSSYNSAEAVRLLHSGPPFFEEALAVIGNAKDTLHVQFYALLPDDTGNEMLNALKAAAARGVKVRVLLDAFGSKAMDGAPLSSLLAAGVEARLFSPMRLLRLRIGRRLHHKIIVADNSTAITGGINVSDKYRGTGKEQPWLDFALLLHGNVCADAARLCTHLFYTRNAARRKANSTPPGGGGQIAARMAHSDWFMRRKQIHRNLQQAIYFSRETVVIVCSYFIPNYKMIRLLKQAADRGVKVSLYLQGKSDVSLARDAGRYWYRALQRHHISIYEFPGRVLHGKLAMVDGKWLTAGSSNFNHLSKYTSVETNTEVYDAGFCSSVMAALQQQFDRYAVPVPAAAYLEEKNPLRRFRWWISWQLSNLLMLFLFRITSKDS